MVERERNEKPRMSRDMSRRQMLGFVGSAAAVATLAGCGIEGSGSGGAKGAAGATAAAETTVNAGSKVAPSCVLAAEATEGPYYVEESKVREDITEGKAGVPLRLKTTIVHATECTPIENAAVDIWHCDARGHYSGYTGYDPDGAAPPGGGQPPQGPPPGGEPPEGAPPEGASPPGEPPQGGGMGQTRTTDSTFLRGVQLTDDEGVAEFDTVYPGWYAGRALHIHLKVLIGGAVEGQTYDGGHVAHTGQLFFPEETTDKVAKIEPYASRPDDRLRQEDDSIFLRSGGKDSIVELAQIKEGSVEDGYVAEIVLGVDPDATPDPVGMGGDPGGTGAREDTTAQSS